MENYVSTVPARADRGSDTPGNLKKHKKRDLQTITLNMFSFFGKLAARDIKRMPFGTLFGQTSMAKMAQACDKLVQGSHHALDMRKRNILDGTGAQTS